MYVALIFVAGEIQYSLIDSEDTGEGNFRQNGAPTLTISVQLAVGTDQTRIVLSGEAVNAIS
jgi:hypothetical protein